jgi:hypothetical protein
VVAWFNGSRSSFAALVVEKVAFSESTAVFPQKTLQAGPPAGRLGRYLSSGTCKKDINLPLDRIGIAL